MTPPQGGEAATWINSAGVVVTFLAGFGVKWLTEIIQHRHVTEREREARRETRRELLLQRRYDFQRQTLLDLQDACMRLGRATAQVAHHDVLSFRATKDWHGTLLGAELDNESREAQAITSMLMVRVRDVEVRRLVDEMKSHAEELARAPNESEANAALYAAWKDHEQLNQRIGEVLREMEDGELLT